MYCVTGLCLNSITQDYWIRQWNRYDCQYTADSSIQATPIRQRKILYRWYRERKPPDDRWKDQSFFLIDFYSSSVYLKIDSIDYKYENTKICRSLMR
jgi:lipopolysaccharide biosynthesis glycosyltransferase